MSEAEDAALLVLEPSILDNFLDPILAFLFDAGVVIGIRSGTKSLLLRFAFRFY